MYAYYDENTQKTKVISKYNEENLFIATAKSSFMVWNADANEFEKKTNVIRPVLCVETWGVLILTDEGLAYYINIDILAAKGGTTKPRRTISLGDASHCLQAIALNVYCGIVTLTDKGMIQYVRQSDKDKSFSLVRTTRMAEGMVANVVF